MTFTKKMKKLLITSAVLAFIGIVLCAVGFFSAKVSGAELFSQKQGVDGQYVYAYDFDASLVKKISLELSYADVNVMQSEAGGRIELVNYPVDNFRMTVGATTIAVKEKSTLSGLFSFSFDGFRNYLTSANMAFKNRSVNIYLPKDSGIKLLDFDIYSGDMFVSSLDAETDMNLDFDYGSVAIDGAHKLKNLNVKIGDGNLRVRNSEIYGCTAALEHGYQWISSSSLTEINSEICVGYFKLEDGGDDLLSGVLRLKSDEGRVRYRGDIYESGSFSQGMEYTGVSGVVQKIINVNISKGNIMVT